MILLTSTSDLLRVTTSSAAAVKVHASHVDRSGATITPGRLNTAIASATTTTIVASPAASTDRTVKFVSIYNDDASLSVTVTILHTDGTTAVDMWSATLAPQQGLQYDEGAGWSAPDGIYATAAQGAKADTSVQPGANANVLGSGSATDNFVLTANGAGGVAWEAAAGGGGTPGGSDTQVQFNDGGAFGGDSGFTFDKTNNTLNVTGATITASDPIIDMAQTWNNGAVTFTALKANVTDTASAAGSLLMDLQVGGVSRFSVGKGAGAIFATNLVEQRNGTAAQAFNLYNTYTNDTNYERGTIKWSSNVLLIDAEKGTTGTQRHIRIGTASTGVGLSNGNATGVYSVACGNSGASGNYTFAAGESSATGAGSIAMGRGSSATATNSIGLGYLSSAYQANQFSFSNRWNSGAGDCQMSMFVLGAATTDATATIMATDTGSSRMVVRASTTWAFEITVVGRSAGGTNNAMYVRRGMIKRDASNNTTLVGAVDSVYTNETDAAWDVAVTANDTNESLEVTVTGVAATNINWTAKVILTEVGRA